MELLKLVTIQEAVEIIRNNTDFKLETEKVLITQALGRFVAEDIYSPEDVPDFRRSTVDGYAVVSSDVFGASESLPAMLTLVGESKMGEELKIDIFSGECVYVPTGGMIPNSADSVVMIEYTERLEDGTVLIQKPVAPNENVIEIGEDVKKGELIVSKGTRLRPYEIAVLANCGITEVQVYKKLRVAIIPTGDEIVEPDKKERIGQVRNSNSFLLHSLSLEEGVEPVLCEIIEDDFEKLRRVVGKALNECDVVLISGGSSAGVKDQTLAVMNSFENSKVFIHGIAIKPGKPTIVGKIGEKFVFGLPGHPLACAVIFKTIVTRYFDVLRNHSRREYPILCKFAVNYRKAEGRAEVLPVKIKEENGELIAQPIYYESGLVSRYTKADGYILIEKELEGIRENQIVKVYKL